LAELAVAAPGYRGPPLVLPNADVVDNDQHLADNLARRLAPSMSVRRRVPPALPPRSGAPFVADAPGAAPLPSKSESTASVVDATVSTSTPPPLEPTKSMVAARVNSCLGKLTTEQLARLVLAVRHLQRAMRATRARLVEQKTARAQMFRDRVADEILKSEREYVSSLIKCSDVYLKSFRSSKALSKEQVTEVFSGVFETIVLLSRTLLSDLELRMAKWSPDTLLGDIFIKIVDFMKVYVGYIENFDTSIRVRQELLKSKRYRALLEKCTGEPGERHDLASFLIMPVQRLPRYILLLRELYKHTPPTHADEPLLAKAVEKVSAVAEFVNEKKRSAEQLMQLHVRCSSSSSPTKTAGRRLRSAGAASRASACSTCWRSAPARQCPT
jgi:FYVE/RhoGEF/PH domain-containing protein 5/6